MYAHTTVHTTRSVSYLETTVVMMMMTSLIFSISRRGPFQLPFLARAGRARHRAGWEPGLDPGDGAGVAPRAWRGGGTIARATEKPSYYCSFWRMPGPSVPTCRAAVTTSWALSTSGRNRHAHAPQQQGSSPRVMLSLGCRVWRAFVSSGATCC